MKLGTKINLVLTAVVAITLTAGFWVIIGIEAANIQSQVTEDTSIVTKIVRQDAERILSQTLVKKDLAPIDLQYLQKIVDEAFSFGKSPAEAPYGFFHNIIIFDQNTAVLVNNGKKIENTSKDDPIYIKIRQDVASGAKTSAEYERAYDGMTVIVHVEPIMVSDGNGDHIVGVLETHNMKNAYQDRVDALRMRMLGVGIVFTAIVVIVLAVILEKQVVGPIRRYSLVAQKVAAGDLKQKVESRSNDEIGRFGEVFNLMVANLRELDQLKSDFVSVAAHQLRTPLSGLNWVLKLFIDGDLGPMTEYQKKMLDRGIEANQKMIVLVNDLLNVSRIENGKFGYKFEKGDFTVLLKTLVANVDLFAKEHNIEVRTEHHGDPLPAFTFDMEKLTMALQNIVDNALKYTLPGGHVTISTEKAGDYVEIKISDTGVGIPKAEVGKLFSKFFRASNVIHLQTDGSGLGLFISKNIIIRHGGQVWVESEEGKGTTFTVVVPLKDELLPKEQEEEGTTWKAQASQIGSATWKA